jgi:hypothetical protein
MSDAAFRARMDRIESLVAAMEASADPAALSTSRDLVGAVLDLHREALARALAIASATASGEALVNDLAADGLVGSVLLLHDLHPADLATRVRGALERVRATFRGAVTVALVGADDGAVRVRVDESPPGAAAHVRVAIEEAVLAAAPDALSLAIAIDRDEILIPVDRLRRGAPDPDARTDR